MEEAMREEYTDHLEIARDISNMKIRGAGRIARMGAYALSLFAGNYGGDDEEFRDELLGAARTIFETRPTAVSLENALLIVLNSAGKAGGGEEMRQAVDEAARGFIEYAENAFHGVNAVGAGLIEDGDVIHTHCNSSAVIGSIVAAHRDGKRITVHSTESRPRYQGRITVKELAGAGVKVRMMVDSAARLYMEEADRVFVGADTISSDGSLYNKIGTWQIALAARDSGIPFYSCAETFKFSPRTAAGLATTIEMRDPEEVAGPEEFPGVEILNPAFDHTPAELIAGIVTERGIVEPRLAPRIIDEMFGGKRTDHFY